MLIISNISDLKNEIHRAKKNGKTIGFVPTMGALHEGHLSLIKRSLSENDQTVVSIFVNPTQFGQNEDYNKYPRSIEKDRALLQKKGVDIVFEPTNDAIYFEEPDSGTIIYEPTMSQKLCGVTRPDHFKGVTSIVLRLFNLVQPTRAYFGEKDYQQLVIIKKMVRDLFLDVEIVPCSIERESNGLALSSRNVYLSTPEKSTASFIYQSLQLVKTLFAEGETDSNILIDKACSFLLNKSHIKIDYFKIVDPHNLEDVLHAHSNCRIIFAGFLGKTRLIDNAPIAK